MTEKGRLRLHMTCTNQDGAVVLDGEAVVSPPEKKMTAPGRSFSSPGSGAAASP